MARGLGHKIGETLKTFDMYGAPVQLGINGRYQSKSFVGAIITLGTFALSIYSAFTTISNMIYQTNPIVTRSIVYGLSNITINNQTPLNLSLSFYYPKDKSIQTISNSSNNWDEIKKIYQINYTCTNCTGLGYNILNVTDYSQMIRVNNTICNQTNDNKTSIFVDKIVNGISTPVLTEVNCTYPNSTQVFANQGENITLNSSQNITSNSTIFSLTLCDSNIYNDVNISSLSSSKSKNVTDLFRTYSYCFPSNFSVLLMSEDLTDLSRDTSFTISIPINSQPLASLPKLPDSAQTGNQVKGPAFGPPQPNQQQPGQPTQQQTTQQQPTQQQTTQPTQQQPTQQQPTQQQPTQQQPTQQQTTQPTQQQTTQPTQQQTTQPTQQTTNVQKPPGLRYLQTPPPTSSGSSTTSGSTSPTSSGSSTTSGSTSPTSSGSSTTSGSTTSSPTSQSATPSSTSSTTPPTSSGSTTPAPQSTTSTTPTQTTTSSTTSNSLTAAQTAQLTQQLINGALQNFILGVQNIDNNTILYMNVRLQQQGFITNSTLINYLQNNSDNNAYPKLLIINDQMTVTDRMKNTYQLYVLDYKDSTTGNAISYDIFVSQIQITVDKTVFLVPSTNTYNYYTIMYIEKNIIDSSTKSSAKLNLKVFPQKSVISIKYIGISDVLSSFGSFFSVFSLIANVLSGLYRDFFYKADLVNSIFTFISNEQDIRPLSLNQIGSKKSLKLPRTGSDSPKKLVGIPKTHESKKSVQSDIPSKYSDNIEAKNIIFQNNIEDLDKPNNDVLKINDQRGTKKGSIDFLNYDKKNLKRKSHVYFHKNVEKNERELKKTALENDMNMDKPEVTAWNFLIIMLCKGCVKKNTKLDVLVVLNETVTKYTNIDSIIKCQIELFFLRKIMLNNHQNMIFKFMKKNINFDEPVKMKKYLNEIKDRDPEVKVDNIRMMNSNNMVDRMLLQRFDEYFKKI